VEWLTRGWDQGHGVSAALGVTVGITLVATGFSGLAEVAAGAIAAAARWALWQIPPPGRSRAPGPPPDGLSLLARVVVAALGVVLLAEIVAAELR
jgi:hypothetical protein